MKWEYAGHITRREDSKNYKKETILGKKQLRMPVNRWCDDLIKTTGLNLIKKTIETSEIFRRRSNSA